MGELNYPEFVLGMNRIIEMTGKPKNYSQILDTMFQEFEEREFSTICVNKALDTLAMNCRYFPTKKEFIRACEQANAQLYKEAPSKKHYGCSHCKGGTVYAWDARYYKEKPRSTCQHYALPCGYCHEGESLSQPFYIQHHDRIAEACTGLGDGLFVARFDKTKLQPHEYLKPVYADAQLDSLHNGPVITDEQFQLSQALKLKEVA